MSDFGDWFLNISPITRTWFAVSVAFPFIGIFGLIDIRNLILIPQLVISRFQLWRPITATFFSPLGLGYLVNLYFLYHYSTQLETGVFDTRPADYVFMLLFNWICIVITGMLINMQLLMSSLVMSVLYVWAQYNKDMTVAYWFDMRFKAHYLPWVVLVFNFIIRGSFVGELTGNLVGHLYYFLTFKYPVDLGGRSFISTPDILYHYFPNRRGVTGGFRLPPARRPVAQEPAGRSGGEGRHNWGQGHRLGAD